MTWDDYIIMVLNALPVRKRHTKLWGEDAVKLDNFIKETGKLRGLDPDDFRHQRPISIAQQLGRVHQSRRSENMLSNLVFSTASQNFGTFDAKWMDVINAIGWDEGIYLNSTKDLMLARVSEKNLGDYVCFISSTPPWPSTYLVDRGTATLMKNACSHPDQMTMDDVGSGQ